MQAVYTAAKFAKTQGNWSRLNLSLSRTALLPAQLTLVVSARLQASLSGKNLDGSERMSVSGVQGVAAYPSGELSGDHAALLLQAGWAFSGPRA